VSRSLRDLYPPLILLLILGLLAELGLDLAGVPAYLCPRPSEVIRTAWRHQEALREALGRTGLAALTGLLGSALGGGLLALTLSLNAWVRKAVYPLMVFFQTVPIVAIAPMMVIWVGYGRPAVILSALIVSLSPIVANSLQGLLSADPALVDLFRMKRASSLRILLKLRIPSAIPQFLTGLRIAAGLSVIGAIVGEFVADTFDGGGGIGTLIESSIKEQETPLVFAALMGSTLLGLTFFVAVGGLSHLALRHLHIAETRSSQG
jgi:NitT/TauT family transport system permease protein